jgi:polyhydroxyalkanoate synthase
VSTDRRQLRPPLPVALARTARSLVLRAAAALSGAPHVVEVALGLTRAPVAVTPRNPLGNHGPAVLWHYPATAARRGPPVLLVHSVVTRSWVLDLLPGVSLVQALQEAGRDVHLLDWGTPGPAQADAGLEAYAQVLLWAQEIVRRRTRSPALHLVGYCAGGTLALATHAAHGTAGVASLAVVAAPGGHRRRRRGMGRLLGSPYLPVLLALDGRGLVPASLVRESFHALRPRALRTVRQVLRRRSDPLVRSYGGALGRWAWDQTPLPGRLLLDLVDLFRRNALLRGELVLAGRRADLTRLAGLPVLLVTTVRDHIVPPASTTALASVPGLTTRHLQCRAGHVAMLAGTEGQTVLYPGLVAWLDEQDQAAAGRS